MVHSLSVPESKLQTSGNQFRSRYNSAEGKKTVANTCFYGDWT